MRVLVSSVSSFWLSREAVLRARELDAPWAVPDHVPVLGETGCWLDGSLETREMYPLPSDVPRHDPVLLQVFDELGGERMAGYSNSTVECLDVPDDVTYFINSYVSEWVAEEHRTWSPCDTPGGRPASAGVGGASFTRDSVFVP